MNKRITSNIADKSVILQVDLLDSLRLQSGTGNLPVTFNHTSKKNYFDAEGILRTAYENEPAFAGSRVIYQGTSQNDPSVVSKLDINGVLLPSLKGIQIEQQSTNSLLQSRELSTSPWRRAGTTTPVLTKNQVGIDGIANTAWLIEDDDVTVHESVIQEFTIPNDSNTHTVSFFIRKDGTETRFPELGLFLANGTSIVYHNLKINTKTGAGIQRHNNNAGVFFIEPIGNFWRVQSTITNNTTGNTTFKIVLYPAVTTTWGIAEAAATGSIVVDQVQVELNSIVATSPIFTTTTPVTRAASTRGLEMPLAGNFNQAAGTLFIEFECNYNKVDVPGHLGLVSVMNSATGLLYQHNVSHKFTAFDGVNSSSSAQLIEKNIPYKAAVRWNKHLSKMQVMVNGIAGTEVTYDGAFTEGDMIRFLYDGAYTAYIKNVRILGTDLGTAECIQLTG